MKSWFQDNYMEIYSAHNEEKSVVAEKFIRTLKKKIYKYMTSSSKNVYIDKLNDENTHHSTMKVKPVDVISSTYIDFNKENSNEYLKFEVGDHEKILKYKIIFAKGYTPNWS